jgi:hypothetical protein
MGECVQETDVGIYFSCLSCEASGLRLLTSVGAITIHKLPLVAPATANKASIAQVITELRKDHYFGYSFSLDRYWITWHRYNLLWLPAEFRPGKSVISGCTAVIGWNLGRSFSFDSTQMQSIAV